MRFWVAVFLFFLSFSGMAKSLALQGRSTEGQLPQTALVQVLTRLGYEVHFPYDTEADISVNKLMADVANGDIDLMWLMSTPELEKDYLPVYFPVYRGLLGMRVGLIKQQERSILAQVRNLNDLKRFPVGQGKGWADTSILEANGLNVVQAQKYMSLFHMLEGDRFTLFPRGLFEAYPEADRFADLNLTVDENLLIKYTAPMYFFTRKGNAQLAQEIYSELERMAESGEYQQLFFADSMVQTGLSQGGLKNRTVIELDNPNLSPKAPLNKKEFWFQTSELE